MSSTPNIDYYHQVTGPGGERSGQELVKNLQAIEKDYSKAFEDILAINKEYGWCYSASLRLHEVEPDLALKEKHLLQLQKELASTQAGRVWDNSKYRKPQIEAEIEQLQKQVSDLVTQKHNLSTRIEHSQTLYRSRSGGQGAAGTILDYCAEVVAEIGKLEKELDEYTKKLALPLPTEPLLSRKRSRSSFKQEVRRHLFQPEPVRPSPLSSVLNVGNSLSKSILPSAGTYRKHMIYSQL
ncbi:hypothetical protein JCM3765_006913 [Sporobolomyces pararoseus]